MPETASTRTPTGSTYTFDDGNGHNLSFGDSTSVGVGGDTGYSIRSHVSFSNSPISVTKEFFLMSSPFYVNAAISLYVTVYGGTGQATATWVPWYTSCDGSSIAFSYECGGSVSISSTFTFGVPIPATEYLSISGKESSTPGYADASVIGPYPGDVLDSNGNLVVPTLVFAPSVPEPPAWMLMFAGFAALAAAMRKSRRVDMIPRAIAD
jgi:hypothetical protein